MSEGIPEVDTYVFTSMRSHNFVSGWGVFVRGSKSLSTEEFNKYHLAVKELTRPQRVATPVDGYIVSGQCGVLLRALNLPHGDWQGREGVYCTGLAFTLDGLAATGAGTLAHLPPEQIPFMLEGDIAEFDRRYGHQWKDALYPKSRPLQVRLPVLKPADLQWIMAHAHAVAAALEARATGHQVQVSNRFKGRAFLRWMAVLTPMAVRPNLTFLWDLYPAPSLTADIVRISGDQDADPLPNFVLVTPDSRPSTRLYQDFASMLQEMMTAGADIEGMMSSATALATDGASPSATAWQAMVALHKGGADHLDRPEIRPAAEMAEIFRHMFVLRRRDLSALLRRSAPTWIRDHHAWLGQVSRIIRDNGDGLSRAWPGLFVEAWMGSVTAAERSSGLARLARHPDLACLCDEAAARTLDAAGRDDATDAGASTPAAQAESIDDAVELCRSAQAGQGLSAFARRNPGALLASTEFRSQVGRLDAEGRLDTAAWKSLYAHCLMSDDPALHDWMSRQPALLRAAQPHDAASGRLPVRGSGVLMLIGAIDPSAEIAVEWLLHWPADDAEGYRHWRDFLQKRLGSLREDILDSLLRKAAPPRTPNDVSFVEAALRAWMTVTGTVEGAGIDHASSILCEAKKESRRHLLRRLAEQLPAEAPARIALSERGSSSPAARRWWIVVGATVVALLAGIGVWWLPRMRPPPSKPPTLAAACSNQPGILQPLASEDVQGWEELIRAMAEDPIWRLRQPWNTHAAPRSLDLAPVWGVFYPSNSATIAEALGRARSLQGQARTGSPLFLRLGFASAYLGRINSAQDEGHARITGSIDVLATTLPVADADGYILRHGDPASGGAASEWDLPALPGMQRERAANLLAAKYEQARRALEASVKAITQQDHGILQQYAGAEWAAWKGRAIASDSPSDPQKGTELAAGLQTELSALLERARAAQQGAAKALAEQWRQRRLAMSNQCAKVFDRVTREQMDGLLRHFGKAWNDIETERGRADADPNHERASELYQALCTNLPQIIAKLPRTPVPTAAPPMPTTPTNAAPPPPAVTMSEVERLRQEVGRIESELPERELVERYVKTEWEEFQRKKEQASRYRDLPTEAGYLTSTLRLLQGLSARARQRIKEEGEAADEKMRGFKLVWETHASVPEARKSLESADSGSWKDAVQQWEEAERLAADTKTKTASVSCGLRSVTALSNCVAKAEALSRQRAAEARNTCDTKRKEWEDLEAKYQRAFKRSPSFDATTQAGLARANADAKRYDQAAAQYDEAIRKLDADVHRVGGWPKEEDSPTWIERKAQAAARVFTRDGKKEEEKSSSALNANPPPKRDSGSTAFLEARITKRDPQDLPKGVHIQVQTKIRGGDFTLAAHGGEDSPVEIGRPTLTDGDDVTIWVKVSGPEGVFASERHMYRFAEDGGENRLQRGKPVHVEFLPKMFERNLGKHPPFKSLAVELTVK